MGTPEFAVPSLRALVEGGYNVVAVVTVPDRAAGRGLKCRESDVKVAAQELGIKTILQPEKLRDEEFVKSLEALQPDLGIVIAFRMLPEIIWAMPKYGTFNLHASLLPQYRGAAPINWAIINGERETGVTTFLLNHEIDKGRIIGQRREPILDNDCIGTLYDRLMNIGTSLVLESVDAIAEGRIEPIEQPQSDENLRPAPKIFKEDCEIDWSRSCRDIRNFVRGLSPYPAAWCRLKRNGEEVATMKVFEVHVSQQPTQHSVGTIVCERKGELGVVCGDGIVYLDDVQMAGKRRMAVSELLLGLRNIDECRFN